MRLIDADALKKKLFVFDVEFHDGHYQKYYVYKEKDVDDAPTIDAVPVVRCKDCKHRQEDTIFHKLYCDGREVVADGYCFKAERRSDETDY